MIIDDFKTIEKMLREHLSKTYTVPEYVWFSVRVLENKDCVGCSKILVEYSFEKSMGSLDKWEIEGILTITIDQLKQQLEVHHGLEI